MHGMAHKNIREREAEVKDMLKKYGSISPELRRELAAKYGCHISAIRRDICVVQSGVLAFAPSKKMKSKIFNRDGGECKYCLTNKKGTLFIIEHVVPFVLGGPATDFNLVVACHACNMKKRSSVWVPINFDVLEAINKKHAKRILKEAILDFRF